MKSKINCVLAVMLSFVIVFGGLSLNAIAADEVILELFVLGPGTVNYTGGSEGSTNNHSEIQYDKGESIELSASGTFLYWINQETNRILSTKPVYVIATDIDSCIEAVFNDDSFSHQVAFVNFNGDISHTESYTADDTHVSIPDDVPSIPRYQLGRWPGEIDGLISVSLFKDLDTDYTQSRYAGNIKTSAFDESIDTYKDDYDYVILPVRPSSENVIIVPEYILEPGQIGITYYPDGVTECYTSQLLYDPITITALDNPEFDYWIDDDTGEIVCLRPQFTFKAVQDHTYRAVFDALASPPAVMSITGVFRDVVNDEVTFYSERCVLQNYTVTRSGILLTFDSDIGNSDEDFVINQENVLVGTAKIKENFGNYTLTKINYDGTQKIFARGYVEILQDGQRVTFYSDIKSYQD